MLLIDGWISSQLVLLTKKIPLCHAEKEKRIVPISKSFKKYLH